MATLSEAVAAQSRALTEAFKLQQNREAAKVAALVALLRELVGETEPGAEGGGTTTTDEPSGDAQ